MPESLNVLIAGCGFVGQETARQLQARGHRVVGLTHSEESAERIRKEADFEIITADLGDASSLRAIGQEFDAVIHCASSGRRGADQYRKVYLEGCENLSQVFPNATLLFTSSTSVYPQTDGSVVTEESDANPTRETGQILRETEEFVLSDGGIVARLSGLYGPGRSVLLQRFHDGTAIIETGESRFLNQIHRDDVASALVCMLESAPYSAGQIYNVSDGAPTTQRETFESLAQHFGKPEPPEGPPDLNRKRAWTHKQISNAKLRALGWSPEFPSFLDAVKRGAIF
ncbi:MAG: NAD-dependent epimerase/dehydratase family protein [Verrucomicrobiota bacterium]